MYTCFITKNKALGFFNLPFFLLLLEQEIDKMFIAVINIHFGGHN